MLKWILALALLASGCNNKYAVKADTAALAVEAGDYTALVEGCGHQPIPGYTYCRVHEGQDAGSQVFFLAPPAVCLPKDPQTGVPINSCAHLTVYDPNGANPVERDIPRSVTRLGLSWQEITGHAAFQKGDRGFWPFIVTWHWIDVDGRDQTTMTEGEIRMRVIAAQVCDSTGGNCKAYAPMNDALEDPAYVWQWVDNGAILKATTSGRIYAGPAPSPSPSVSVEIAR